MVAGKADLEGEKGGNPPQKHSSRPNFEYILSSTSFEKNSKKSFCMAAFGPWNLKPPSVLKTTDRGTIQYRKQIN